MDLLFDGSLSIRERDDFRVAVIAYYVNHLTTEEIAQIRHRCESNEWHQNCQVLWSGLDQQQVQQWVLGGNLNIRFDRTYGQVITANSRH
jgi:hypothetical protein